MTLVDNYFPFDTGPGGTATPSRWRLMARNWAGSGVIPNYNNQCRPTLSGSVLTIDTGGVWIDGFYGENQSAKTISVSGGDGLMVARMDPNARQVFFNYNLGAQQATQTPTGIYEIPIARVTSGTLVDIRQFASAGPVVPSGVIMDFGGSAAPGGWLLCNGTSYRTTDYPTLFAVIQYTWGGSGANFSVPNLQGRVLIGAGAGSGLTNRVLAGTGGEENHTLSVGEMAAHGHGINDPGHVHYRNTRDYAFGQSPAGGGDNVAWGAANTTFRSWATGADSNQGTNIGILNAGGNAGHNNMQPFAVTTKIIKT